MAEFDRCEYPSGEPTLDEAWLGIYQLLWWFHGDPLLLTLEQRLPSLSAAGEEFEAAVELLVGHLRETREPPVLHVREANDLGKPMVRHRAGLAAEYIADALAVEPEDLEVMFDRMMRLPRWAGKQRQNPLGNGLRVLVSEVLARWGDSRFTYPEESLATSWFPGIKMSGRSDKPKVDVAALRGGDPRGVVSCKWSIRHDRVSDPTNECTAYKAAAIQRQVMDLTYVVVTNELDEQRLDKVLNQPCVDALVHVHLDLVRHYNGGLSVAMRNHRGAGRLLDLTDLVALTYSW